MFVLHRVPLLRHHLTTTYVKYPRGRLNLSVGSQKYRILRMTFLKWLFQFPESFAKGENGQNFTNRVRIRLLTVKTTEKSYAYKNIPC